MMRGAILIALVKLGHDATLNEAIKRFYAFLNDKNSSLLPPDIRKAAYVAVMQKVSVSDKSGSLGSCPDSGIVLEVLNFLLLSEVRPQDGIIGLRISIEGRETAWKWLKDNWNYISKVWGSGALMSRFVKAIVSPFSSLEKLKEVEEFFASRTTPNIARTLKQSLESIQINAKWVQSIQKEQGLAEALHELALGV